MKNVCGAEGAADFFCILIFLGMDSPKVFDKTCQKYQPPFLIFAPLLALVTLLQASKKLPPFQLILEKASPPFIKGGGADAMHPL